MKVMGVLNSQKIAVLYDKFKTADITFTKEIIQVTGLIAQQVCLKCGGDFWPCIIYSASLQNAKVIANIQSGLVEKLQQANNVVSLRFCFKSIESANTVTFFVSSRSIGYTPYNSSKDVVMFTLQYTQRPPDDLIEVLGRVLDANINSAKRRDERILINSDTLRRLNMMTQESAVFVQGVPRRCVIRDVSFSGSKLVIMGMAKFLENREAALRIDFDDPRESFLIKGKFVRSEMVDGRKDLVAMGLLFDEETVPIRYKIRINEYVTQVRADNRTTQAGSETLN